MRLKPPSSRSQMSNCVPKRRSSVARIQSRLEGIEDAAERKAAEKQVLEELLPEAFAIVREAGRRVLKMRHFDVQISAASFCTRARFLK